MDYDDTPALEQWCSEIRSEVATYLAQENVTHGEIGDWPAFHVAPHVSVWAIESHVKRDWLGWWVICGKGVPTDYVSAAYIKDPRKAVLAFANRWHSASERMARGEPSPEFSIGLSSEWPTLAPKLAGRAELLRGMVADTELWDEP